MMTPKDDGPILAEWLKLSGEERRKLFPKPDHLTAAAVFAHHADKHRTPSGDFAFKTAKNMAIMLTPGAVKSALTYDARLAQALAKVVTLDVGSRPHRAVVQTLIELIHHLEAHPEGQRLNSARLLLKRFHSLAAVNSNHQHRSRLLSPGRLSTSLNSPGLTSLGLEMFTRSTSTNLWNPFWSTWTLPLRRRLRLDITKLKPAPGLNRSGAFFAFDVEL